MIISETIRVYIYIYKVGTRKCKCFIFSCSRLRPRVYIIIYNINSRTPSSVLIQLCFRINSQRVYAIYNVSAASVHSYSIGAVPYSYILCTFTNNCTNFVGYYFQIENFFFSCSVRRREQIHPHVRTTSISREYTTDGKIKKKKLKKSAWNAVRDA